jgi:hypothetical protein
VPQIATPGWVTGAASGTSRAAISDWKSARYSAASGGLGLGGERVEQRASLQAGVLVPEDVRGRRGRAGGERLGGGAVADDVLGERQDARGQRRERGLDPGDPGGGVLASLGGPGAEGRPGDERRAAAQVLALQHGGESQVGAASAGGAVDQRVLEEDQEVFRRQRGTGERGEPAEEHAGRGQRQGAAGAVVGDDRPAVELGGDPAGQPAVGGDEGGALARLRRLAQAQRDGQRLAARVGGLDPGEALAGGAEVAGERRALAAPLVGDRGGAQRKRDQRVPGGCGWRDRVPEGDGGRVEAEGVGEAAEAVLRVVGGAGVVGAEAVPNRARQGRVEARQHQRALREPGDGGHEGAGRAARAGGAGDDDRMARRPLGPGGGERLRRGAEPPLAVAGADGGEIAGDQRQEAQAALPVGGVLGDVEGREGRGRDPLALHLVEELGEAVGEVEDRGAGGELGLGGGEPGDEARQLELAAERRHRGGEVDRQERIVGELGDDADPRQQPRRPLGEEAGEPAGGAAGVGPDLDPHHRLRRLASEPRLEPGDQRAGEVDARRQREDARGALGGKQRHRASSASASAMPSGRPTSTQDPRCTTAPSRSAAISASQTWFSEKTASGTLATTAESMICAPA